MIVRSRPSLLRLRLVSQVASIGLLVTVACAPAESPTPAASADPSARAAVDSTIARLTAAVMNADANGALADFSEDYVSLETPGQAVAKPAYRVMVDTLLQNGRFTELEYEPLGTHFSGDLAVYYGHARVAYEPRTGQGWSLRGNYMHVFRREPDGAWRLVTEIVNSTTPPPDLPTLPANPK